MTRRIAHAAILTFAVALALTPASLAGKPAKPPKTAGGGATAPSMRLVLLDGATEARHHGRITFEVSTTATTRPYVGLRCWQGYNFVLDGYVGYFPTYAFDPWFTLGSPYWDAALPANCTARLFYFDRRGREKLLSTMGFAVAP
jgi:hypothetical protein